MANSDFKDLQDISTVGGVILSMLITLWVLISAKSPEKLANVSDSDDEKDKKD